MGILYFSRGVLLQRQNRLEEALQWYKNAIHFRPKLVCKLLFGIFESFLDSKDFIFSGPLEFRFDPQRLRSQRKGPKHPQKCGKYRR